ncbi:MAG: hypothetical protein Q9171_006135 [Xanthocarpia ochracea]
MKSEASQPDHPPPPPNDWHLTNNTYILSRSRPHASASRLNLQYHLWQRSLGYTIHPSILPSLPSCPLIADIASGTGLWLCDVASQLPTSTLHGYDIDLKQCPPKEWLPSNTEIRDWDLLGEVRDEMVAKYDYIHTRLLVLVVQNQNPQPIIRSLFRMLKPGGYLQWDELDTTHTHITKTPSSSSSAFDRPTPALDALASWSKADGRHDWTVRLPEFLKEEGFEDTGIEYNEEGKGLTRAFSEQHLLTAEEWAEGLVKLGEGEKAEVYFGLVEKAWEEGVEGAALCVPRIVCVARKPL